MKKMISSFGSAVLSREQMKAVIGGKRVTCEDSCGMAGSSTATITVSGSCASSSLTACQGYAVNGAISEGMDWCTHTCW